MSRISDALVALGRGETTLDDVAALFAQYRWVRERPSFEDLMRAADQSAEQSGAPPVAYFTEVESAVNFQVISTDQYALLAQVVARLREHDARES